MNLAPDEYINLRVDDQINWYSGKSSSNQRWFKLLRFVEIVTAALIPFLSAFMTGQDLWVRLAVGTMGVVITVITGIISLYQFQENWIEYRVTCESLKHEKYLFLTKTRPYDDENAFSLFVERIEALISVEHTKWYQRLQIKRKDKDN